jgi:hypothetical protein
MLDSTGGVRLVRACTAMEPNATLSVPVVQCTGRSRFLYRRQYSEQKAKVNKFRLRVMGHQFERSFLVALPEM